MPGKARKIDARSSTQLSIFDTARLLQSPASSPAPGSFNISSRLRESLTEALKGCSFTRYEAAARMSELLGVEVTKSQLDCWTADSKEGHRFPAEYLAVFCHVTGAREPLRMMATLIQCHLFESREALAAELGKIVEAKRSLSERERAIRSVLRAYGGADE